MIALVFGWLLVGVAFVLILASFFVSLISGGGMLAMLGLACMFLGAALVGAGIIGTRLDALAQIAATGVASKTPGAPVARVGDGQAETSSAVPRVVFVPPGSRQYRPPPGSERNTGRMVLLLFGLIVAAGIVAYLINPLLINFDFLARLSR